MDNFRHLTPIEVRFRDLDVFGHVNNGVIFTYIETARIRYLIDVGVRSPQVGWNDLAFILAHINCDFRKPIFYGQRVEVGSRIVEIKRSSLRLAHRVEADGELAAEGDGVLVHFDYVTQSSMPISPEMRAKLEAFERATFNI
ncbi:MAG: acyl-CoA thioesterase [Chloroflexi bacterium]|nr:acyl-CoA thioesterase [Chloroflexota bacterium]NOG66250.1 acyl-CoA thioesterase [Chloroflexota bacterium]GIK40622.1 MAG: thioesterase [Chloroflexota bacterium]